MADGIPRDQYPTQVAAALYVESGIRTKERDAVLVGEP
jgi:tryptophanase